MSIQFGVQLITLSINQCQKIWHTFIALFYEINHRIKITDKRRDKFQCYMFIQLFLASIYILWNLQTYPQIDSWSQEPNTKTYTTKFNRRLTEKASLAAGRSASTDERRAPAVLEAADDDDA